MKKRLKAQVSIFVIVAIVLIVGGGTAYLITRESKTSQTDKEFFAKADIKPDVDNIKTSIISCMDESSKDSLETIGIQGGYYDEPSKVFDLGWAFIPYYYNEDKITMPSKSEIEIEIGKAVDKNIINCIKNIKVNDFEIKYNTPRTKVSINKENVEFVVNMLVSINKQDNTMRVDLKDNPIEIESKIDGMIEVSDYLMVSLEENSGLDPKLICISCLNEIIIDRGLFLDMVNINDNSVLYIVSQEDGFGNPYLFEFINKYPDEKPDQINELPAGPAE